MLGDNVSVQLSHTIGTANISELNIQYNISPTSFSKVRCRFDGVMFVGIRSA
jgi:hypothetical protein